MSTFTPEQVRELVDDVAHSWSERGIEKSIIRWLEQNPVEPVVVGLGDKQVVELHQALSMAAPERMPKAVIKDYLRTQTFTQPQVKEMVVGLSDEQIKLLSQDINNCFEDGFTSFTPNEIKLWLKTQTFADTYEDKYNDLYEDYQSLIVDKMLVDKELEQLKSQQFEQNWDDAPSWANWLAQDEDGSWHWHDNKPMQDKALLGNLGIWQANDGDCIEFASANKNWKETLQERPKPTPCVEAGQVWRHASEKSRSGDDYEVTEVVTLEGKFKIGDEWQEDVVLVTYENDAQDTYRRTLSDFLAKFERVQS